MPELARFYGITIHMNSRDHPPPHVHVRYSGALAAVDIAPLRVAAGRLPGRVRRLVFEWVRLHRVELADSWARAQAGLPLHRLPPLE